MNGFVAIFTSSLARLAVHSNTANLDRTMNTTENELIAVANKLLANDSRAQAGACLRATLRLEPGNLTAHNLLEEHRLDGNLSDAFSIDARISPEDDIYRFFANHPSSINPIRDYLSDGWRTLAELMVVLEAIDRPLTRCQSFLEFACGFGRFTRHLVRVLPPEKVHVSDIVAGSVDFLKSRLSVNGFYSAHTPEALVFNRRYEVLFALSLFSHLPPTTWTRWLVRLFDGLEPNGVLIFTTHGERSAANAAVDIPPEGFLYLASSESNALSSEEYGSSFVSSGFVRQTVFAKLRDVALREFPAHFWGSQDAFAIVKSCPAGVVAHEDEVDRLVISANRIASDPRLRESVWRHCAHRRGDVAMSSLKTAIHDNDQMLRHSLRHFHAENPSLSQYFNVALQQYHAAQQILRMFFADPEKGVHVLDFACGYGRLLRFLTLSIPSENIWAAEIQANAVNFVAQEYGVHALHSVTEPACFDPGRKFHFIWVASLFSHLPERLFLGWLSRLHGLLEPEGALCFSVHDECLLPAGIDLPETGIWFVAESENADLDTAAYGTAYVSETFVADALARAVGPQYPYRRIRRALANEQDLYVIPGRPDADVSKLSSFRRGPWGWVDRAEVDIAGRLQLGGWAASFDDGGIESVTVSLDGQVIRCPTGSAREDVARVLGDERFATSGWQFSGQVLPSGGEVYVEVSAETSRGESALLYAGTMTRPT